MRSSQKCAGDLLALVMRTLRSFLDENRLIVIVTLCIVAIGDRYAEKIPIANGMGWDGAIYGSLAKGEFLEFEEHPLDRYRIQRILPSTIVYAGLRLVGAPLSDANVVFSFGLLNVICASIVAWCWVRTADLMAIGTQGKWLGFCALILNFAILKHTSYYPVLTDIPAYAIGSGMLYFYLRRNDWGLVSLAIVGAFVWPLLLLQGSILFLFPRTDALPSVTSKPGSIPRGPFGLNFWIAGLASYYVMLASYWSVTQANLPICGCINPSQEMLPLSFVIVAVYLYFALSRLIDVTAIISSTWNLVRHQGWRLILVLAIFAAVQGIYSACAPLPGHTYPRLYLLRLFIKAIYLPGVFLVGHAVYFGPIVPLIVLLWSQISSSIRDCGMGITLAIAASLMQGLDGESRHLIHAFPLIVPFAVLVVQRTNWGTKRTVAFAVLSAFCSKFWMTINSPGFETSSDLLSFPLQGYTMNYGVFMNTETFLIQGAIMIAVGMVLFEFIKLPRSPKREQLPTSGTDTVVTKVSACPLR